MSNSTGVQAIYEQYTELFGTNKPMLEQFFIYVKNVLHGDFGFSFSQYPTHGVRCDRLCPSGGR